MLASTQQVQLMNLVKQRPQLNIFSGLENQHLGETGNFHMGEHKQKINSSSNKNCLPMASDC